MNVDLCLDRNPELKPRIKGNRRKSSMQDETYQAILDAALSVSENDWRRIRAYALVLLCIDAGTRNKEIRFAEVGDLDTKAWTLDIVHVKGEATYGEARIVPIREEIRPVIARYLKARARWVVENECASKALFPSGDARSEDGFMCGNSLRRMKDLVEDELHIRFDLRECRRTFGQRYLDSDLEISSVSVLMGHATTKTTERFYGRQKNKMAIEKARATWSASAGTSMTGEGSEGASQGAMVDNESSVTPSETPVPLVDNVASVTNPDGGQSPEIGRQAP